MTYFRRNFKYNIKKKLIWYRWELDKPNFLIKVVIKFNNNLYKLAIEICYSNFYDKTELYLRYASYYSRRPRTNR